MSPLMNYGSPTNQSGMAGMGQTMSGGSGPTPPAQNNTMPGQNLSAGNMIYNGNNANQSAMNTIQGNTGFNQNQFNQYMNPYVGDVANNMASQTWQNFGQQEAPMLQSQFGGGGQFGSGRSDMAMDQASRNTQQNLMWNQSQLMNQGFQNAMNNYQGFQKNALGAGAEMGELGQGAYGMGMGEQMAPLNMINSLASSSGMVRMPSQTTTQSGTGNPYYMAGV